MEWKEMNRHNNRKNRGGRYHQTTTTSSSFEMDRLVDVDIGGEDERNNATSAATSGVSSNFLSRQLRFCATPSSCCSMSSMFQNLFFIITPHEARVLVRVVFTTTLVIYVVQRVDSSFDNADTDTDNNNHSWSSLTNTILSHLVYDAFQSAVLTVVVMTFFVRKTNEMTWIRYLSFISCTVLLGLVCVGGLAVLIATTATICTIHVWHKLFLDAEMELANERNKLPPRARVKALDYNIMNNDDGSLLYLVAYYTGHVVLWWRDSSSSSSSSSTATAVSVYNNNNIHNQQQQHQTKPIRCVQFLARNLFVAATDDGLLHLMKWTTSTTTPSSAAQSSSSPSSSRAEVTVVKCIQSIPRAHDDFIRSAKHIIHEQKHYLLTCSDDLTIKLWHVDMLTNMLNCCKIYQGHEHYIMQVATIANTNSTFASCSLDGTIKIWNIDYDDYRRDHQAGEGTATTSSACESTLIGHENGVNCIDFGYCYRSNQPYLVSGSDDRTIRIWDYEKQSVLQTLVGHEDNVTAVASIDQHQSDEEGGSGDGSNVGRLTTMTIVSASEDGTCRIWNGQTGSCLLVVNVCDMGRAWALVSSSPSSSLEDNSSVIELAVGFDAGCICLDVSNNTTGLAGDLEKNACSSGDVDGDHLSPLVRTTNTSCGECSWKVEQAFILSQVDMVTNCPDDVEPQATISGSPTLPTIPLETQRRLSLEQELRCDNKSQRQFCYVTVQEESHVG